jgi:hypothetical protein
VKSAELLPQPVKPHAASAARRVSGWDAGAAAGASSPVQSEPHALAGNNVVAMPGRLQITAEHRALLDEHFNALAEMVRGPLRAKGEAQRDANTVYGLRRALNNPNQFEFYNLETKLQDGPENPTGRYYFAVRVDEPNVVRLGNSDVVHGHVSVARFPEKTIPGKDPPTPDVYFAGVMYFRGGRLVRVTNGSGHYRPPLWRIENLTQWVKRMLIGADIREGR